MIIELAPMEGLTGYINRNALAHNFGGIDIFYTPFIPAAKTMSKKIKVIDGIRYHADRPDSCRACYFYKNRKIGCILGKENCYYLAEVVKTEQEKKCEGCCYAKGQPCVSACCYKDLDKWLQERRKKAGGSHE